MTALSCAAAREQMLTAEPRELEAGGDSALSRHIRRCPACRRAAAALCSEHAALADSIDRLSAFDPSPPRRAGRRLPWAIPATVVAAVAVALVGRGVLDRTGPLAPITLPSPAVPTMVMVNADASHAVAIMRTSNPDITVVWQMESAQ